MFGGPFLRLAGWSAYVSAVANILGMVFIAMFFSVGQPFGTLNDVFGGVVWSVSLIPLALAFWQLQRLHAPTLSLIAAIIGLGGMLLFVFASGAVIFKTLGLVNFVEPRPGTGPFSLGLYAPGIVGIWLLLVGYLSLSMPVFLSILGWIGVGAGAGYVVGLLGFALFGVQHPVTIVAGMMTAIGYPIWAFWLGRLLVSGQLFGTGH